MTAGDALDVLVAEKVMGWSKGKYWGGSGATDRWFDGGKELGSDHATPEGHGDGDYYSPDESWSPSTDIRAAWEVVEKLPGFGMTHMRDGSWHVAFGGGAFPASADTAPLAICRAALAAIGATT